MNSFFIVNQTEQALVLQVGKAQAAYNAPGQNQAGLKMKLPFVQNVIKYDRRNIGLDIPNIEVLASNQEQLIVDAFVRYQISDPLAFYQRRHSRALNFGNVDECVLPARIRRNKSVPFRGIEPLYCTGSHKACSSSLSI